MLTMKLIVDRLSKEGILLDRREQPSKSWTLRFLQMLYLAHANIKNAAPYPMTDVSLCDTDGTKYAAHQLFPYIS